MRRRSGDGRAQQARTARRRGEEEAVGQTSSEQQAMQELDPQRTGGRAPTPTEDATKLGEEEPPRV